MLEYLANFATDGTLQFSLIEQAIPYGYRPKQEVFLPFFQASNNKINGYGRLCLKTDGTSHMVCTTSSYTEHSGTLMYFTDDSFPED